jgi:hypothetical protein
MSRNKADYLAALERPPEAESITAPSHHEDIAALAYQMWLERRGEDGTADEDWFEAERELGVLHAKTTTA